MPKIRTDVQSHPHSLPLDETLENLRSDLIRLGRYAVHYRYPGESATKPEAQMAFDVVTAVRKTLIDKLETEN